ncbi:MAG: TIGR03086 family protein, partial [Acidobacteria bacterium]|nr:TIGR03086 family protein [Acidobacteriota bacterium]
MPRLERKVRIPVGPRRIVAAFFDPDDLRRWLGAGTSTTEPRDGG